MKKRNLIVLMISIIVTLLGTFLVGNYSYKRYDPQVYKDVYEEFYHDYYGGLITTKDRIKAYRNLENYYYDESPIYEKEVKDEEGDTLFVIQIYRNLAEIQNNDTKEIELKTKYEMFVYKINHTKIKKMFEQYFDDTTIVHKAGDPIFVVNFYPTEEYNKEEALLNQGESDLKTDIAYITLYDYESNPTLNGENPYISQMNFFRESHLKESKELFENNIGYLSVDVKIKIDDETERTLKNSLLRDKVEGLVLDGRKLDESEMTEGAREGSVRDQLANVGYNQWLIKKYVWWQAGIAFVVVGLIMTGFYFAFTYEEPVQQPKKRRK